MEEQTYRSMEQSFQSLRKAIIEIANAFMQFKLHKSITNTGEREWVQQTTRLVYSMDFTRPLIKHQVTINKPRYAVRKVIKG